MVTPRAIMLGCTGLFMLFFCAKENPRGSSSGPEGFSRCPDSLPLQTVCAHITRECFRRFRYKDPGYEARYEHAMNWAADSLRAALGVKSSDPSGAAAILGVVYGCWGIGFDCRDTALETLLPALVFDRKKGACLGVSLIILTLAQRIQCPIFGVMLPGHFFCRFDNGARRFNIEPNRSGMDHPDEYYRVKYLSSNTARYDMRNLSAAAAAGVLYYNVGEQCWSRRDFAGAVFCFKESARRCPDFAEARGNLALAWWQCGNNDSAQSVFESLLTAYPNLEHLAANYGGWALQAGRYNQAFGIFKNGLQHYPRDTSLLFGLEQAYRRLGLHDSAWAVGSLIHAGALR